MLLPLQALLADRRPSGLRYLEVDDAAWYQTTVWPGFSLATFPPTLKVLVLRDAEYDLGGAKISSLRQLVIIKSAVQASRASIAVALPCLERVIVVEQGAFAMETFGPNTLRLDVYDDEADEQLTRIANDTLAPVGRLEIFTFTLLNAKNPPASKLELLDCLREELESESAGTSCKFEVQSTAKTADEIAERLLLELQP